MKTYPWVDEMFDVDVLVEGRVLVGDDVDVLLRISPAAEDQGTILITPRPVIIQTNKQILFISNKFMNLSDLFLAFLSRIFTR
jgi:hypothetical protein